MRALLVLVFLIGSTTATGSKSAYFPKHAFGDNGDQFATDYYGSWLSFFHEPSLLKQISAGSEKESYRFLWLRTFHHAVVIRIDVAKDGTGNLVTKTAAGAAGFGMRNRKIAEDTSRQLSWLETQSFLQNLSAAGFWSIQGHEANETSGNDGSEWIIEAEKNGQYHVVARWTPCDSHLRPNLYHRQQICSVGYAFAFGVAHLNIPKDEVY